MKCKPNAGAQQGSVLIEAMAAMVIFSIGILSMLWLQASATRQVGEAKYRLEASFAANQVLGQAWVHRNEPDKFVGADQPLPSLPNGRRTVARNGSQYTITISWQVPGERRTHSYQAVGLVR